MNETLKNSLNEGFVSKEISVNLAKLSSKRNVRNVLALLQQYVKLLSRVYNLDEQEKNAYFLCTFRIYNYLYAKNLVKNNCNGFDDDTKAFLRKILNV